MKKIFLAFLTVSVVALIVQGAIRVSANQAGLQALELTATLHGDLQQPFSPIQPLVVRFNQAMKVESSQQPLMTSPFVTGKVVWNSETTELIFTPDEMLQPNVTYLVFLDDQLVASGGSRFAQAPFWELHTHSLPEVIQWTPRQLEVNLDSQQIQVYFSRPMDQDSILNSFRIEPELKHSLIFEKPDQLSIQLTTLFSPGETYTFIFPQSVKDVDGLPLAEEERRVLTTRPFTSSYRLGARSLYVNFNYPLDVSKTGIPVTLEPALEGTWKWVNPRDLVFTADRDLSYTTRYTASFSDSLVDLQGNHYQPPPPFSFQRETPVRRVLPEPGDDYAGCKTISIHFAVPMNESVTQAAFQLTPSVDGNITWDSNVMTFHPLNHLMQGQFTAQLDTKARTVDGEEILSEEYTWTFSCQSWDRFSEPLSWGYGEKIQVVDAAGRRALLFSKNTEGPLQVTFDLYPVEKNEFVRRFVSDEWFANLPEEAQKTWTITTPDTSYQEMFLPGDIPPGLYILKASEPGGTQDNIFVVLTRYTTVIKQGKGEATAWVTRINGEPTAGAKVELYAGRGEKISQGETDADGLYEAKINPVFKPTLVLAAAPDGEITLSGMDMAWISQGCWYGCEEQNQFKVYTYTDRPIYRPGQVVYFKSILRWDDDAIYRLVEENTPVTVNLRDGRKNILKSQSLRVNGFGTIHGEFDLSEGNGLGLYSLEVVLQDESFTQGFKVEDYRKPDIQIELEADEKIYLEGEKAKLKVHVTYFDGQAAANADVTILKYKVYPQWDWWWDGDEGLFSVGNDQRLNESFYWDHNAIMLQKGKTDENGDFVASIPIKITEYGWFTWWKDSLQKGLIGIEAVVDDGSNQQISASTVLPVFNSEWKVNLEAGSYFKEPGEAFSLEARLRTLQNEPVANQPMTLIMKKYNRQDWDYTKVSTTKLTSDEGGKARTTLTIEEPGDYLLTISAIDSGKRTIEFERYITVLAGDRSGWMEWRSDELTIYSEFDRYQPGQTARFMIESQFSGPALLTLERGKVLRSIPVQLTEPLTQVEVPLATSDAPNVFVTISAWQGIDNSLQTLLNQEDSGYYLVSAPDARLRTARVEIQVDASFRRLQVEVTPDQASYSPGQPAKFQVKVTDLQGKPVSAELSLALVDEAIFSLSDELSGPIFDAFYRKRTLTVRSYNSMQPFRLLRDDAEGGGGGGDGSTTGPRNNFPDTAIWIPVVRTGLDGTAILDLTLPDNLTTWRATVKAVSRGTLVGEAVTRIVTSKELSVRPVLPRSLTVGDRLDLAVWVHNYSQEARQVQVTLSSDRLGLEGDANQTVNLLPGEVRPVVWPVIAQSSGTARVKVEAIQAGSTPTSDAVELPLTIHELAAAFTSASVGEFSGDFSTTFALPKAALPTSRVTLRLHQALADNLFQGLEYLTGYPYGCVEQTMSRALPNAAVGRVIELLGWSPEGLQRSLPKLIEQGVNKLYGMQHSDGGWGWWVDDLSQDYQTAWVVYGLAVTAEAGYPVEERVIQSGVNWLKENLAEMDIRTRAYALYSLAVAGSADQAATLELAQQIEELDPFSQAALALALNASGEGNQALEILDRLSSEAITDGGEVYWTNSSYDGEYNRKTMASNIRTTALALDAFLKIRPADDKIPGIVKYLMRQRNGYGWGTTNETAYAVIALTNYILTERIEAQGNEVEVTLNGKSVYQGPIAEKQEGVEISFTPSQLEIGVNDLSISMEGEGKVYYEIDHHLSMPLASRQPMGALVIHRRYQDAVTKQELSDLQAGQLVEVILKIEFGQKADYVLVEDHLPGGLEALNESLNTTSHAASEDEYYPYYDTFQWEVYGYNNKEIFGDRVTFFITQVNQGILTLKYQARATQTGEFFAPPAEVYPMYDLSLYGRTGSAVIAITP